MFTRTSELFAHTAIVSRKKPLLLPQKLSSRVAKYYYYIDAMKRIHLTSCLLIFLLSSGCSQPVNPNNTPVAGIASSFIKGADISWLTEMENAGYKFYNNTGVQEECMQLLKEKGMNAVRLRVWVNPANGWCNTNDVLVKALRAKKLGLKIMIDFHYSDVWADPGHQQKPAAWAGYDINVLANAVASHTSAVMNTLQSNGITPEWAQVGNETNDGMLWEEGRASVNMKNFAQLINSGFNAIKSVSASTKVIVHISNGYDNALFRWIFDGLKANGANWDVIGLSLYPETNNWQALDAQCLATMNDMADRYGKEVMLCEVGMDFKDPVNSKAFLTDIITKTKSVTNGKGLGVFYWEPECYNWVNYNKGAFDSTGKPTIAMDAFSN